MPQPGDVPSLRHRPRARAHPLLGVGQAGHLAPVVAGGLERVADGAARRGQVAGERVGLQDQASAARQVELVEVGAWPRVRRGPEVDVEPGGDGLDRGHDRPRLPACLTSLVSLLGQDGTAMTDLLNRPSATSPSERSRGRLSGLLPAELFRRRSGPPTAGEPEGRPLTVTAAIAAVGAAGTTMVTFMGLAVIGWFLADAGAHGQTTDALRVGADVLAGRPRSAADGLRRTPGDRAADRDRGARGRALPLRPLGRRDRPAGGGRPHRRAGGHDPHRHLRRDRGGHLRARRPGVRQPQPRPGDPRLHAGRRHRRHPRHGRRHRPAPRLARAGARPGSGRSRTAPRPPSCSWSRPRPCSWLPPWSPASTRRRR